MPYSASNPPSKTHTLTPSGRRQWVHVFNSALKRGDSEESAHRMAWAAARKAGKRKKKPKTKSSKLKKLSTLSQVNNVLKGTFNVNVFHPEPPPISKEAHRIATVIQVKDCVRGMLKPAGEETEDVSLGSDSKNETAPQRRVDIVGKNFSGSGPEVTPEMQKTVKDYNSRLIEMLGLNGVEGLSMLGGGAGVLYNLLSKKRNDEGKVESRSFSDSLPWLLLGGAGYAGSKLTSPPDDTRVNEIIAKLQDKPSNPSAAK